MNNYTVTFVYNGDFDLPNDPEECSRKVPGMVLKKLQAQEFELADFNLTSNYTQEAAAQYIEDRYVHRAVVEMVVGLGKKDMESREAIYNRCVAQMEAGKLYLGCAYENENLKLGMLQSVIKFVTSPMDVVCAPPAGKL